MTQSFGASTPATRTMWRPTCRPRTNSSFSKTWGPTHTLTRHHHPTHHHTTAWNAN